MKTTIVTLGLLAAGIAVASAQEYKYSPGAFPYDERHHAVCQKKATQLYALEHRGKGAAPLTDHDRRLVSLLQKDLNRGCGGYRRR